ncbi:protein rep [Herbiconiux sp. VKM Ac-2851]|nr:protein rep [Herbiconiux sp. VKM Ac-2851]
MSCSKRELRPWRIRLQRVAQIVESASFVTLSVPTDSDLDTAWRNLELVWSKLSKSSSFSRQKKSHGLLHNVRAAEVTYNESTGQWHPHLHIFLLFSTDDQDATHVSEDLLRRWKIAAEAIGVPVSSSSQHWKLVPYEDRYDTAGYLVKQGPWPTSIKAGTLLVGDILRQAATGSLEHKKLWTEYERAAFGRTAVRGSQGFDTWADSIASELVLAA